ncbi:MAG: FkbM family methyltransferase [Alphaproteobacteria bacterium]|nr:FkbM family methyltransferase [Alphaproteobacteria bacterium]
MNTEPTLHAFDAIIGLSPPVRIVDIGANPIDGEPPYATLLASEGVSLLGFEPQQEAYDALIAQAATNMSFLRQAVFDGGTHPLNICHASGMTSLLEPNQDILSGFPGLDVAGTVLRREPIQTVRLDDVEQAAGADYLKIDIQGGELTVFQNAHRFLETCVVIQTEVLFREMYRDQPLFSEIELYLRNQGFQLLTMVQTTSVSMKPFTFTRSRLPSTAQLFWGDILFIKDVRTLSGMPPQKLLSLARVLHDVYRVYDVCFSVLQTHDRVAGSRHCEAYLRALAALGNRA